MMYSEKLVTAVKSGGKILREFKDNVYVPFGSEYSLLIKNLNTVKCSVNVYIDGSDIADGDSFIIPASGEIELHRSIRNGNMQSGNKFKFIERTNKIEQHRGVQVEDGLIRIEFEFEKIKVPTTDKWVYSKGVRGFGDTFIGGQINFGDNLAGGVADCMNLYSSPTAVSQQSSHNINDTGITVPGSISDQKFIQCSRIDSDNIKHVMVLKLLGEFGQSKIEAPITVATKPTCTTCGKVNKATSKFCTECGTSLQLI